MLIKAKDLTGYALQSHDGEIGHVADYIIDDDTWTIQYIVVDTRNWIPGREVLISPEWKVFVNLSRDAIKQSPLHGHYNREGYWVETSN